MINFSSMFAKCPFKPLKDHMNKVVGVGLARGIGALDLQVIGGIFMSWVITLPVGALLSIFFFFFFRGVFL